jgi:chlorophyllide a reductase subunit X
MASSPWSSADPEVGRGCGGRGIIHGFETLEKLGFHDWDFDYVLLDFLGDVVCGGFGLPIARDMCQKVIVVASNDLQSLYVANNVCSAVEYFRRLGGNVGVAGMVTNKDDGTGEARPSARPWVFPSSPRFPPTRTSAARAPTTRLSVARRAVGFAVCRPSRSRSPTRRRSSRRPLSQDDLLGCSTAMPWGATWSCSRRHRRAVQRRGAQPPVAGGVYDDV